MKMRYAAILPLFFLLACSNDQPATNNVDTTPKKDTTQVADDEDMPESTLPSPLAVASMFKRSGLKYLPGLINTTDKAGTYSTMFSRAENMGVYSSDMAYCVMNKQSNEGGQLLKVIRDLGKQINLGNVFDQGNLYDRFNKNLDNEDSLGKIIADIQFETDKELAKNDQNDLYGVIFAGAWIEAMYVGCEVYKKDGNDDVVAALVEQMVVSRNIVTELKNYETKDPSMPGLIKDMTDIRDAINAMPSMKKLDDDQDIDFKDVHPTKEELAPVIKKIEDLRNKMISNG
ncbi:MAG TPA: hypothetical protein VFU15_15870 [Bacteroidia bacterium]|nr:hypothetical protein [Bacteroidia bacterium]